MRGNQLLEWQNARFFFFTQHITLSRSVTKKQKNAKSHMCPLARKHTRTHTLARALFTRTLLHKDARAREKPTRATMSAEQQLSAGERHLWDMIVDNDDICFKHILPRLNRSDIKFLYEVNSETRALVKRSSRVDELNKAFEVYEMSSISTMEFAWDNFKWGTKNSYGHVMDQAYFCHCVAATNKLELLEWVREEKVCEWDEKTISRAACHGNLDMLKFCVENQCPLDEEACMMAAGSGSLECLKYLHEEVKAPWDWSTAAWAAGDGNLHILEYLVGRKYDQYNGLECSFAAEEGHLDCLKYLHETAKAPWDEEAVGRAHRNGQSECLQYLLVNNFPLPEGWRYEDGELYSSESESESGS